MNFIHVIENVIPPDYCEYLVDKYEKTNGKHQGYLGEGVVDSTMKKCTDLHPTILKGWQSDVNKIDKYLGVGFLQYLKYLKDVVLNGDDLILRQMFSHLDGISASGIQIQRYNPGDYFNWHCDDSYGKKRLVAYIIYLNSMGKEDGGKTQFLEDREIIPKAGSILFFPSTWSYIHRGESVKNGKKYIITGFINEVI